MSKFTVGQVVKVREGLEGDNCYGDLYFHPLMREYCGKEVTIKAVNDIGRYYVNENSWTFTDEMLEEVIPPVPSQVIEIDQTAKLEIYVEKVIVNDPATIMFYKTAIHDYITGTFSHWSETKKVVAKVNKSVGDTFDVETGVNVAMLKAYRKEIDKLLRKA
ncbi:hypothetical protein M5X02_32075 [Paenibacillus alvei]|uniref:hypothetical protein n=1 Tax=Paenibacillus alvei TaxID=44250 RepID=UPI00028A306D|nr:hypothetical protein [Paenibacillus alvei]EJW14107.1 hypothetical protein PAV_141p02130 [Paenibacillus alvei DSM 29]MCY9545267.1 hypothetical protein [Paenibacillus alvei]MCY9707744.1 hypothetical protein [Paenibacillus alvei]MEC0082743.1 hypothetical protein [Paenibacillus alvei]